MKKILLMTMVCLLLCTLSAGALANGWGLRGGVLNIVSKDETYDEYTADADDGNASLYGRQVSHAIMSSRYHSQLITAFKEDGLWAADVKSTLAVYQPGDSRAASPSLSHTDNGFRLSYGDREYYIFEYDEGEYVLTQAVFHADSSYSNSLMLQEGGYLIWQSGRENAGEPIGDGMWTVEKVTLDTFNITLLPRTMQDARQMSSVAERLKALMSSGRSFGAVQRWPGEKKGEKLAVYSAPDKNSYRASSGKASVSTSGEMLLLGEYGDWTLVSYEVSSRTRRIGFVNRRLMSEPVELPLTQIDVRLDAIRDTYLTDDPDVSQYAQVKIPAGTSLKGLAVYGDYYAYVAYEQAGQTFWGFVPLRDLNSPAAEMDLAQWDTDLTGYVPLRWDVMDLLIGKWEAVEAADSVMTRMELYSNGAYKLFSRGSSGWTVIDSGRWRLTDCPVGAAYAERPLYEVTFVNEVNAEMKFGLSLSDEGVMTLYTDDFGGEYVRNEYSTYGNG
ncbi:MAG: hypothetical protein IJZ74_07660 [Clostridia bacterium]|nr:hypothetical protein [Clostridia bacterium]